MTKPKIGDKFKVTQRYLDWYIMKENQPSIVEAGCLVALYRVNSTQFRFHEVDGSVEFGFDSDKLHLLDAIEDN